MTKIKNIKDLGENEVVHCPTEKEAIAICQLMHDAGLKWGDGDSLVSNKNYWDRYMANTCYRITKTGVIIERYDFLNEQTATIHPASSFLSESFYQVEPKVGDKWTCLNKNAVLYNENITIGSVLEQDIIIKRDFYDDALIPKDFFFENFKFHSNTETMIDEEEHDDGYCATETTEPISERKRESFRFYDQLPPELARQAKENFREDTCENVPTNLFEAIQYGWWWSESKHGNFSSWCRVRDNAQNGKYNLSEAHSSVIIDPMKHELLTKVFEELDEQGKSIMRKHFSSLFPKVKEYVRRFDWHYSSDYVNLNTEETINMPLVLLFKNCTPEIVGNEIRFVKD